MPTLSDYRDRPHWSYSSLNQLLNICSLQYFFEKIEKRPRPFTPVGLVCGSVFHRVMEWIALNRMEHAVPSQDDTRDLFHALWERELSEGPPMEPAEKDPGTLAEQGAGLVVAYLNQIDPDEQVLQVNRVFAVPAGTSERPVIGEIDCITEQAGEQSLIDWKTSARRWPRDQADKSLQPTVYLYAMNQIEPGVTRNFRFDVAVKNKKPVVERTTTTRTPEAFLRLERLIGKAEEIVGHGLFYPSDQSFACSGCQFREPCRQWHRENPETAARAAA